MRIWILASRLKWQPRFLRGAFCLEFLYLRYLHCIRSSRFCLPLTGFNPVKYDGIVPSRNIVKFYVPNGYYHAYNRGVEKREIFLDDQDYRVFFSFLRSYLSSLRTEQRSHPLQEETGLNPVRIRPLHSFFEDISLLAYCLMPNHFHLLLYQTKAQGMTEFIRALCTSYSMYFNKKYRRVGHLFQGVFKAALVDSDPYLLHVTRYIHLNPQSRTGLNPVKASEYPYSSYPHYLGKKHAEWVHPEHVLAYFRSAQRRDFQDHLSYESFVEDYAADSREAIVSLAID